MATRQKSEQKELVRSPAELSAPEEMADEERAERRKNWLAPAGSIQERQLLRKWVIQPSLSERDGALIRAWIRNPDDFAKRNEGFWRAAKRSVLGGVVYDTAMERHKKLTPEEWLVACLTVEGYKQDDIADMIGKSNRTVDGIVRKIKDKIVQDCGCRLESVTLPQITRWFFGF